MLRAAVWLHRWTGVALSLVFTLWFASGAVLLFVPFPSLPAAEAAAHAAAMPPGRLAVAPAQATARGGGVADLHLVALRGEPVYVLGGGRRDRVVSGVTGREVAHVTAAEAEVIASSFAGTPASRADGPFEYDQWVVHQQFDHARPFLRVRLADVAKTDLYVSARTGEVMQRTRAGERAWNWAGAVAHWIYVVPIRRSFALWDGGVWTISLAALATTLLGVGLGVWRTWSAARAPRPRASPFKGWLRWHHLTGLVAGLVVTTWILSGWLSMDHGRLFPRGGPPPTRAAAYAGVALAQALRAAPAPTISAGAPVGRVDFVVVGSRLITATPFGAGGPAPSVVGAALARAWPGARVGRGGPASVHDFWARAEGLGPEADRYDLGASGPSHVYVSRATGRLLAVVDAGRAAYDVVYYGLHTFQWPGLSERPLLRIGVVCVLLALGGGLCSTSLVLSVRRLRMTRSGRRRGGAPSAAGLRGSSPPPQRVG